MGSAGALHGYQTYASWPTSTAVFYVNPANADVGASTAIAAVQAGMNSWNNQAGTPFRLQYGGTVGDTAIKVDNRNVVIFRPNYSSGSTIASTYTWRDSSNRLLDADITFYSTDWTFFAGAAGCTGSRAIYIEDVAAHEFGHAIGVTHSSVAEATMYPSTSSCSQTWRTLASDDIAAARALYGTSTTNTAPTVSISGPAAGASFASGVSITFSGSASDTQDGNITSGLQWTDNGTSIGQGASFSRVLTAGTHTIVARSTDSGGLQGSRQVSITVMPSSAASPDGTTIPGAMQIVDDLGAVWRIGASGTIVRNGLSAAGGRGSIILWRSHTIYVLGSGDWWRWTGSGWAYVGSQPPGGYTSPDGATTPGAAQIVDDLGAIWTIGANGAIVRNGLSAAGGQGSKILWTSRTIYVLGTGNWWRWTGSGWAYAGPQSTAGTSLDGTTTTGATPIVDDLGAVWTVGANGTIVRNGLSAAGGQGSRIHWKNRTIYVLGTVDWWKWTGFGWAYVGPTIV
jgi:hypothetical protein